MPRFLLLFFAAAACVAAAPSGHVPKAVSTDGEATIYVMGDFARGFNIAYNAVLPQLNLNRSASFLGITLLGRRTPGGSIALGLTRGEPSQSLAVFVATTTARGARHYEAIPSVCLPACTLVLRGDRYGIYAFVVTADGIRKLGAWARADFVMTRPYVQLNGEVAEPQDRIDATLIPLRVVVDSHDLPAPGCAFTTRGIAPGRDPSGRLRFTGTYRPDGAPAFIDLKSGKAVEHCS